MATHCEPKTGGEEMRLKNKISVITGAGRGIGRSIAFAFAEEGSNLVLVARSRDQLEHVAQELRNRDTKALPVTCDVSSAQEVQDLARVVQDEFGQIDILVNNAGISKRSKLLEYDDETWLEVIRINLFGTYLCIKAFLPMMQQSGQGRIINIASTAGKNPVPFNTAYSASKHAVLGLTKSVASEVALTGYPGITVNAICPFYVNTEMFSGPKGYVAKMAKMTGMSEEEVIDKAVSRNLQHRIVEPEEVASMAVYLASEEARGITGQALNICGGLIFH
jgi:NAD(P)-dependent dehydrogenase (short-subunit alcohol dehydrogenase family)